LSSNITDHGAALYRKDWYDKLLVLWEKVLQKEFVGRPAEKDEMRKFLIESGSELLKERVCSEEEDPYTDAMKVLVALCELLTGVRINVSYKA